jgi:hypothetical protein
MAPAAELHGLRLAESTGPDGASGRLRVSAATLASLGVAAGAGAPLLLTVTAATGTCCDATAVPVTRAKETHVAMRYAIGLAILTCTQ